ncbi:hypothetical protein HOD88_00775 [archaeon]|jgi:single-stranded DNA-specific DHH superfamily exonuclease|nr:hypothetical protein [archaeon]
MNYLVGSEKEFHSFIDSITSEDKIGIITHIDLDGFASAIILEEILKSRGFNVEKILFMNYSKNMFVEPKKLFENLGITKVLMADLAADNDDFEGFLDFRNKFDSFLIDHHPMNEKTKDLDKVIKTESVDCATWAIYNLAKNYFDVKIFDELVSATMVAEWSFRNEDNFNFLKEKNPGVTKETFFDFPCGKLAKKVGAGAIYYANDLERVYEIIKNKEFDKLTEIDKLLSMEIDNQIIAYKENAEYFSEKDLYFYYSTPKHNIASIVTTILSKEKGIFIFAVDIEKEMIKVSIRNNTTEEDVGALIKKGIKGLENAIGGGHKRAAAARFMKKDLQKFKENLLE